MRPRQTRNILLSVMLVLVIAIVAVGTFLFTQHQTSPTATTASGNTSSGLYPANIEIDNTGYGVYDQAALTNPNIQGVVVEMNWADVEPQQGQFNIVKICAYIRSHYPSAYIQLTPVHQVTQLSQVQGDIAIAQKAGAFTIEWFPVDATTPSFQPALQQWQQTVFSGEDVFVKAINTV